MFDEPKIHTIISNIQINTIDDLNSILDEFGINRESKYNRIFTIYATIKNEIKNTFIITSVNDVIFIKEYLNLLIPNIDLVLSLFKNKYISNVINIELSVDELDRSIKILNRILKVKYINNPSRDKLQYLLTKSKCKFTFCGLKYNNIEKRITLLFPFIGYHYYLCNYNNDDISYFFNTNLICYINKCYIKR